MKNCKHEELIETAVIASEQIADADVTLSSVSNGSACVFSQIDRSTRYIRKPSQTTGICICQLGVLH